MNSSIHRTISADITNDDNEIAPSEIIRAAPFNLIDRNQV